MRFVFPRWTNLIPTIAAAGAPVVLAGAIGFVWYWFSPSYTDVGYQPEQPVPFSHKLHAGSLGMDCRYCHNTVERAARAAIPPTETCMNCHRIVKQDSPKLEVVRNSAETGEPIPWVRVHQLPDYAYFDHSIHLAASVGCVSCHGRVDQMEKVTLSQSLSMGWCLECHRDPSPHLRPQKEITNMTYVASANGKSPNGKQASSNGKQVHGRIPSSDHSRSLAPPEHCSGCHR